MATINNNNLNNSSDSVSNSSDMMNSSNTESQQPQNYGVKHTFNTPGIKQKSVYGSLFPNFGDNRDDLSTFIPQMNDSRQNSMLNFGSDLGFNFQMNQSQSQSRQPSQLQPVSQLQPSQQTQRQQIQNNDYSIGAKYPGINESPQNQGSFSRKSSIVEPFGTSHDRLPSFLNTLPSGNVNSGSPVFNTDVFTQQTYNPGHSRSSSSNTIMNYQSMPNRQGANGNKSNRNSSSGSSNDMGGSPQNYYFQRQQSSGRRNSNVLPSLAMNEISSDFDNFVKRDSIVKGFPYYMGSNNTSATNNTAATANLQPNAQSMAGGNRMGKVEDIMESGNLVPNGENDKKLFSINERQDINRVKQSGKGVNKRSPSKKMMASPVSNSRNPISTPPSIHNSAQQVNVLTPTSEKSDNYTSPIQAGKVPMDSGKSEKPILGATKVDQLMLVIQARAKGVTKPIERRADGTIVTDSDIMPEPRELVGGIEKLKSKNKHKKKFQCEYCLKQFTQPTHLDVHLRSHIGFKPFKCQHCGKSFTQGGNLRTHSRSHTGERPFKCNECGKDFSRKGNLAAHRLTHSKVKPFECKLDGCDKSFTQLGNLKAHQNRFHLATVSNLTQRLADLGDNLDHLPPEERSTIEYFMEIYKNSNKGIKGRGKKNETIRPFVNTAINNGGNSGFNYAAQPQQLTNTEASQGYSMGDPRLIPDSIYDPQGANFGYPNVANVNQQQQYR